VARFGDGWLSRGTGGKVEEWLAKWGYGCLSRGMGGSVWGWVAQ
jgi:hypothetical protein